jgi:hypothetical protein
MTSDLQPLRAACQLRAVANSSSRRLLENGVTWRQSATLNHFRVAATSVQRLEKGIPNVLSLWPPHLNSPRSDHSLVEGIYQGARVGAILIFAPTSAGSGPDLTPALAPVQAMMLSAEKMASISRVQGNRYRTQTERGAPSRRHQAASSEPRPRFPTFRHILNRSVRHLGQQRPAMTHTIRASPVELHALLSQPRPHHSGDVLLVPTFPAPERLCRH